MSPTVWCGSAGPSAARTSRGHWRSPRISTGWKTPAFQDSFNTAMHWVPLRDPADRWPGFLGGGWARMWDDGVGGIIRRRGDWLQSNAGRLVGALTEQVAGLLPPP